MAAPVWVLSVDLQAKTATFQSGMAAAAQSARGSFSQIKGGASEMGRETSFSMMEARHSVMILGEEFGIKIPRALAGFIASLGPVGAAMEAAFPFLAIILGATLLYEHLTKIREAGAKLTEDQEKFRTAAENAFGSMDDKILEAQKRIDELRGNHVAALKTELELIDHQSMAELMKEFDVLAKAADAAFADIHSHWYTLGAGAEGAKHSLESFKAEYAALLAKHDEAGASNALHEKLARELEIMQQQAKFKESGAKMGTGSDEAWAASLDHERAKNALKQFGVGTTENEITAQQTLVGVLQDQVALEQQAAELKKKNITAAKLSAAKEDGKDAAKKANEMAKAEEEAVKHMGEIIRAANAQMNADIEAGWRDRINATASGSAERLAVIDAAIADEEAQGMEATSAYRGMLADRVATYRQFDAEQKALERAAAQETISQTERMGELALAAVREHDSAMLQMHRATGAQVAEVEAQREAESTALQMTAADREMANLDKTAADYANRLKALEDHKAQIAQEGANRVTAIKEKAAQEQAKAIEASEQRALSTMAAGLTQSIMGHQSWAKMLNGFANEAAQGLIRNSLMVMMQQDKERLSNARTAATSAYATGEKIGGPAGLILGPVFAAAAFAGVMAFEKGGIVPGVGQGDIVPAMLTPGEAVLPKGLVERLSTSAPSAPANHYTVTAHYAPTISAVDATGVDSLLAEHGDKFQAHFESTLRRMNR